MIVWKRHGDWAAHAFAGDKKLCNTRNYHFERSGCTPKEPVIVEATAYGEPTGRICARCQKNVRARTKAAS